MTKSWGRAQIEDWVQEAVEDWLWHHQPILARLIKPVIQREVMEYLDRYALAEFEQTPEMQADWEKRRRRNAKIAKRDLA